VSAEVHDRAEALERGNRDRRRADDANGSGLVKPSTLAVSSLGGGGRSIANGSMPMGDRAALRYHQHAAHGETD